MIETSSIDKKIYDFFAPQKDKEVESGFDKIYKNFLTNGADEAKEFLHNLSKSEVALLQHYHGLADAIDIDALSSEGAYNLLKKGYEKTDLNGDGVFEVGAGRMLPTIPPNAPAEFKQAFYDAMVTIEQNEGKDSAFRAMMMFSFQFSKHTLNEHLKEAGISANIAKFDFSLEGMQEYIDAKNNPKSGEYTDPALLKQLNAFFEAFKESYENQEVPKSAKVTSDEMDAATKALLDDLLKKGAAKFLSDLNEEKIEKLIEEKRKELEAAYAQEELKNPKVIEEINNILAQFKKELLEKFAKKSELDGHKTVYSLKDLLQIKVDTPPKQEA